MSDEEDLHGCYLLRGPKTWGQRGTLTEFPTAANGALTSSSTTYYQIPLSQLSGEGAWRIVQVIIGKSNGRHHLRYFKFTLLSMI